MYLKYSNLFFNLVFIYLFQLSSFISNRIYWKCKILEMGMLKFLNIKIVKTLNCNTPTEKNSLKKPIYIPFRNLLKNKKFTYLPTLKEKRHKFNARGCSGHVSCLHFFDAHAISKKVGRAVLNFRDPYYGTTHDPSYNAFVCFHIWWDLVCINLFASRPCTFPKTALP